MILPPNISDTVAFICYRDKKGDERFAGTAFFVRVENERGEYYGMTVTALHIIHYIEKHSGDGKVLLRMNTLNGGVQNIGTSVDDWIVADQEEEYIDVAVFPGIPDVYQYKLIGIGLYENHFVRKETIAEDLVHVGNEVVIVGLFSNHTGNRRNVPITRYGYLAMIPDEKIVAQDGSLTGYLIESRSIGGLSGSPVLVRTDKPISVKKGNVIETMPRMILLGLINGHFDAFIPTEGGLVQGSTTKSEALNKGIAIVVPAYRIFELINRDDVQEARKKYS